MLDLNPRVSDAIIWTIYSEVKQNYITFLYYAQPCAENCLDTVVCIHDLGLEPLRDGILKDFLVT